MKIFCALLLLSVVVFVTGLRKVKVPKPKPQKCPQWIPPINWTLNLAATVDEGYCPYRVLRPGAVGNCVLDEPFTFVDCMNKFCKKESSTDIESPKCCSGCFITRWLRCRDGSGVWITAPQSCTCEN